VGNADIFAIASKGGQVGVQAFFIRGGQNWGHRAFFPSHTEGPERGGGADQLPRPIL
jgi:excinuclease ABC subunit C